MEPRDQLRFPNQALTLKNNAAAIIRPLRRSDAGALGAFYESVPREDFRFYCPHELTAANAAKNTARADSPFEVVIVLETTDGLIAGYAWYRWESDTAASSVFGICVRRGWQECGAGRALIARINEVARTVGPPLMTLTVQQANTRAVALYTRMGFKAVRSRVRAACWGFAAEPEYAMERWTRAAQA